MLQVQLWRPIAACVPCRHQLGSPLASPLTSAGLVRSVGHQARDAGLDAQELAAARTWFQAFRPESIPKGSTTYSRSSGPGGQHVNKLDRPATPANAFY